MSDVLIDVSIDEQKKTERPWKVILYNDDVHTFDEVILQIQKATGSSLERSTAIAYEVDARGRAVCYEGDKEDCHKVAAVLRQIHLQVEVDH